MYLLEKMFDLSLFLERKNFREFLVKNLVNS